MLSDSFIDFDGYWERYRERVENPPRYPGDEPDLEEDLISFDAGDADDIEKKYGGPLDQLDENDLLDIVKAATGIAASTAEFDKNLDCIVYKYDAA